jgi:kynurenine formamidase
MRDVAARLARARVFDLAQPWRTGMPHWPSHPPYLYSLTKAHGEVVLEGGASSAADAIALGTHTGTHIDALGHFSCDGLLRGGVPAAERQSYAGGLREHSIDAIAPLAARGVLLDIAALAGVDALPADFVVTPEHLAAAEQRQQVTVERGDVVLLRTGWALYFDDPARFVNNVRCPGPELAGARWLSARGVRAAGSDTVAFERVPSPRMAVHVHLLVESGIHILEVLNLETLAAAGVTEFLFVAAPLKLQGATGSPIRPLAFVD